MTQHLALSTQHLALSTQHLALSTQHSALSTLKKLAVVAILVGFGLRMVKLGDVLPRWDEGWSVAHAALSWADVLTITAADVHPPLYYLVLGVWQNLFGVNLFGARYLSIMLSLPAIPLAYVVAKRWATVNGQWLMVNGQSPIPNPQSPKKFSIFHFPFSIFLMAWLPLAVYYSGVVRMYALVPTLMLLAMYFGLGLAQRRRWSWRNGLGFALSAAALMLTLYHAVWALLGLAVYALLQRGRRNFMAAALLAGALYLPWAIYAIPQLIGRASAEATRNTNQQLPLSYWLEQAAKGLTLSREVGWWGIGLMLGIVLAGGIAWAVRRRRGAAILLAPVLLPILMIGLTLFGVAFAARNWALNERMLVGAAPALVLILAWALAQLPKPLAAVVAFGLVALYFSTSTGVVFDKTLEVFDAYDPHQYHRRITAQAQASDVAIFNVLSPAGFYALDRRANDPTWSYALTWDPVIERHERWEARILALAQQHPRLWLVLYRGLAGQNGPLRGWLDSHFYPASGDWGPEEVFIGLYGAPQPMQAGGGAGTTWGDLELRQSQFAPELKAGAIVPVGLTWQANAPIKVGYKIFVHAIAPDGRVLAQHDAQPLNDLRPFFTLPVGEAVIDHHGLALPADFRGKLRLVMGLYDPNTGQRFRHSGGAEVVVLGEVEVR